MMSESTWAGMGSGLTTARRPALAAHLMKTVGAGTGGSVSAGEVGGEDVCGKFPRASCHCTRHSSPVSAPW